MIPKFESLTEFFFQSLGLSFGCNITLLTSATWSASPAVQVRRRVKNGVQNMRNTRSK